MIDDKQLDCWADEMVFAIGEWLKPIDLSDSEKALAGAVKSEVRRIIAEATFLSDRTDPLRSAAAALYAEYEQGQFSNTHAEHRALWKALGDAALKPYEYVVAEGTQEKAEAILSGKGK